MYTDLSLKIISGIKDAEKSGKTPAFAYDRISALAQAEGLSLDYQESRAAAYADHAGLHIVHFFTIIESARKEGRKIFNRMFELSREYNIKHIIFKNTDRMSRNYSDLVMVEDLIDNSGYNIHFYQNNKILNSESNHNDRFILGIEIAVAKQLSDKISHDIKQSHMYKAKQGIPPAAFPAGYLYDKENRVHYKNPKYENMLNFIFDTYDEANVSMNQLIEMLNKQGYRSFTGKKWNKSHLHATLTNPFYCGKFEFHGKILQGNHEPYFSPERFERRVEKLNYKFAGARKRNFEFLLRSFLKCGHCNRVLTGEMKKGQYIYYTHRNADIPELASHREPDILKMINDKVDMIQYSQALGDWIKKLFKNTIAVKTKEHKGNKASISKRISDLEIKYFKLLDLYLEEEHKNELIKVKMDEVQKNIQFLREERGRLEANSDTFIHTISDIIDRIRQFPHQYKFANNEEKINMLRLWADVIYVHKDFIEIQWKNPYNLILNPDIMDYAVLTFPENLTQKRTVPKVRNCPVNLPRSDTFRTLQQAQKAFENKIFEIQLWYIQAA